MFDHVDSFSQTEKDFWESSHHHNCHISLDKEFSSYFQDLVITLVYDPFHANLVALPLGIGLHESLIDFRNDSVTKDKFIEIKFSNFWCGRVGINPLLASLPVRTLMLFCHSGSLKQDSSLSLSLKPKTQGSAKCWAELSLCFSKIKSGIDLGRFLTAMCSERNVNQEGKEMVCCKYFFSLFVLLLYLYSYVQYIYVLHLLSLTI